MGERLSFAKLCERIFGDEVVPADRGKTLKERGKGKGRAEVTIFSASARTFFFILICQNGRKNGKACFLSCIYGKKVVPLRRILRAKAHKNL